MSSNNNSDRSKNKKRNNADFENPSSKKVKIKEDKAFQVDPEEDEMGIFSCENAPDESTKVILMLGLSQNGKSSTANTLLGEKRYPVGDGNVACTKDVEYYDTVHEIQYFDGNSEKGFNNGEMEEFLKKNTKTVQVKIGVLDCPGIGDSNKELEDDNMKKLFVELINLKKKNIKLSSIILCIRSTAFFNDNQQENFKYYQKMFSQIFENCFSVVVTELNKSRASELKRKKEGKRTADEQIQFVKQQIKQIFGVKKDFKIFGIDNYCEKEEDEIEYERLLKVRGNILDNATNSKGYDLSRIKFPKTSNQIAREREEINKLLGQLQVQKNSFQTLSHKLNSKQEDVDSVANEISLIDSEISGIEAKIAELNTDEKCLLREIEGEGTKQYFGYTQFKFQENFTFKVTDIQISEGTFELSEESTATKTIGTAYGGFWSSYHPTIYFYTAAKYLYADQISNLFQRLLEHENERKPKLQMLATFKSQLKKLELDVSETEKKIEQIESEIEFLREEYVNIEDISF